MEKDLTNQERILETQKNKQSKKETRMALALRENLFKRKQQRRQRNIQDSHKLDA